MDEEMWMNLDGLWHGRVAWWGNSGAREDSADFCEAGQESSRAGNPSRASIVGGPPVEEPSPGRLESGVPMDGACASLSDTPHERGPNGHMTEIPAEGPAPELTQDVVAPPRSLPRETPLLPGPEITPAQGGQMPPHVGPETATGEFSSTHVIPSLGPSIPRPKAGEPMPLPLPLPPPAPPAPALGVPLPLVQWEEQSQSFEPSPAALRFLRSLEGRVAVVAVCGSARTGKSFLLNRILQISVDARADVSSGHGDVTGDSPPTAPPEGILDPLGGSISTIGGNSGSANAVGTGFKVSPSVDPCTRGLWLCASPACYTAPDGSPWRLLLVDTEGVDAPDSDENHMARVLAMALSLSCVALLNQRGALTSSSLSRLLLATQVARIVQGVRRRAAQSSPGSNQYPDTELPASYQVPVSEVSGSNQGTESGVPVSYQGPVPEVPASDQAPVRGVPVSDQIPVAGVPASDQGPAPELPVPYQVPVSGVSGANQRPVPVVPVPSHIPVPGVPVSYLGSESGVPASYQGPVPGVPVSDQGTESGVPISDQSPGAGVAVGGENLGGTGVVHGSGIPGEGTGTSDASGDHSIGKGRANGPPQAKRSRPSLLANTSLEIQPAPEGGGGEPVAEESTGYASEGHETAQTLQGSPAPRFPSLFWVLRDFGLVLGQDQTPEAYLEAALREAPECVGAPIREAFPQRACFMLPRPAQEEDKLQNLEAVPFCELAGGFQTGVFSLAQRIMKAAAGAGCPGGGGGGAPSGASLADAVEELVQALNKADLPKVRGSAEALERVVCREALEQSLQRYTSLTGRDGSGTWDREQLREEHEAGAEVARLVFQRTVRGVGKGAGASRVWLEERMREQFETRDLQLQEAQSREEVRRMEEAREARARRTLYQAGVDVLGTVRPYFYGLASVLVLALLLGCNRPQGEGEGPRQVTWHQEHGLPRKSSPSLPQDI